MPYGFMQGCAHRCFFCSYGNRIDLQPARKTVSELRMLVETTGVRDFFFLNNCLNVTARFLDDFLDALLDAGLDLLWADSLRPCQIDETRAARLFQAGCRLATMGVESGSDRVLRAMRKGFTVADSSRAVRALHAAGILTRVNLIAGFPGERPDDVEATIGFVHDHADQIDMLGCFNQFYLLPSLGRDAAAVGAVVREGSDTMPTGQRSLMFDEVGGYRWEERRAATNAAWNRINEAVARRGIFMEEAFDEARLFALFRAGRSSDEVRASLLRDLAPTGVPVLM
ncbi:MAG: radical SAM protein [Planctomycetes bacterium]|nr:radical SAM protein [Planctomycetota bacterium]